jgi:hypothetical protein
MIKHNREEIILNVVSSVYKNKLVTVKDNLGKVVKDEKGKPIKALDEVWEKDLQLKTVFLKDSLTIRGETLTRKNTKAKNRCVIYDRSSGKFFTIAHSLKELDEALADPSPTSVGFKKY